MSQNSNQAFSQGAGDKAKGAASQTSIPRFQEGVNGSLSTHPITQASGGEKLSNVDQKEAPPKPSKAERKTGPRKKAPEAIEVTFRHFREMRSKRIPLKEIGRTLQLKEGQLIEFVERDQKIRDAREDKKATRSASELVQFFRDFYDMEPGGPFEITLELDDLKAKTGRFAIIPTDTKPNTPSEL